MPWLCAGRQTPRAPFTVAAAAVFKLQKEGIENSLPTKLSLIPFPDYFDDKQRNISTYWLIIGLNRIHVFVDGGRVCRCHSAHREVKDQSAGVSSLLSLRELGFEFPFSCLMVKALTCWAI